MKARNPVILAAMIAVLSAPVGAGAVSTSSSGNVSASLSINVNLPIKPTVSVTSPVSFVKPAWEAKADQVVGIARSLIGVTKYSHRYNPPYTMDGTGFTYYVYKRAGIDLGTKDDDKQVYKGAKVGRHDLRKGDMVFFSSKASGRGRIGQAGIYIGNDQFIQIYEPGETVVITRLNGSEWWSSHYVTARRVIY